MKKFFILLVALGIPVIGICGSTPAYAENIAHENENNFLVLAAADSDADSKETVVADG